MPAIIKSKTIRAALRKRDVQPIEFTVISGFDWARPFKTFNGSKADRALAALRRTMHESSTSTSDC